MAASPEAETVGKRLKWAIDNQAPQDKSKGVGLLIKKLEARGERGATYATIRSYISGDSRIPLEFVVVASEELGVNREWLAFGVGHPTESHAAVTAASTGATDWQREAARRLLNSVLRIMQFGQGEGTERTRNLAMPDSRMPHWVAPLSEVRLRLVMGGTYFVHDPIGMRDPRGELPGMSYIDPFIERDIGNALASPLKTFEIDASLMEYEALGDYIIAMVPVLLALGVERQRQHTEASLQRVNSYLDERSRAPKAEEVTPEEHRRQERAKAARLARRTKGMKRTPEPEEPEHDL